jgi:hypothetical protein
MPSPILLQQLEERADQETDLQEPRAGDRRCGRLHRYLLQSNAAPQSSRRAESSTIRSGSQAAPTESPLNPGNSSPTGDGSTWPDDDVAIWSDSIDFWIPLRGWRLMLAVAELYGWNPVGTKRNDVWWDGPVGGEWDGAYLPAVGQLITREDANALAAALERALPDIPDHDIDAGTGEPEWWPAWIRLRHPVTDTNRLTAFAGLRKRGLRAFIAHCRYAAGLCIA